MSVNLLAISVGNTRTQVGAFIDNEQTDSQQFANDALDTLPAMLHEMWPAVEVAGDAVIYLASVEPDVAARVSMIVSETLGVDVVRFEKDHPVAIGRQLDREAIVGEDRLLTACAAYDQIQAACVVIDAGTAVTVDFVDGAGPFHGGAILPGAQIGNGVIVGAGSVVSGRVPSYSIVAGNRAQVVRRRFSDDVIDRLERMAWWDWSIARILAAEAEICGADVAALEVLASE